MVIDRVFCLSFQQCQLTKAAAFHWPPTLISLGVCLLLCVQ